MTRCRRDPLPAFVSSRSPTLLCISAKTVETRRRQIVEKPGISTTAGLTRYAVRAGLVDLSAQPFPPGRPMPLASRPGQAMSCDDGGSFRADGWEMMAPPSRWFDTGSTEMSCRWRIFRRFFRPRLRRDITVPMGMPRMSATS